VSGNEIYVEKGALVPSERVNQASLRLEVIVQFRSGKRGQQSDLHF
jgi:hypothetical protein